MNKSDHPTAPEEKMMELLGIDPVNHRVKCGDCDTWVSTADAVPDHAEETVRCPKCAEPRKGKITDNPYYSDYPAAIIFTSDKFIVTALGYNEEHCEDVLQCVLLGRFKDHEGDREFRRDR